MPTPVLITDHVQAALGRRLEQSKDKPRKEALITAISNQVQELENVIFAVLSQDSIDSAVGAQLDVIGLIVGEPRNGALDATYRALIRIRIQRNLSFGEPNRILDVVRALTEDSVELEEYFPAGFRVLVNSIPVGIDVIRIVKSIKPAGVDFYVVDTNDNPFSMSLLAAQGVSGYVPLMGGSLDDTPFDVFADVEVGDKVFVYSPGSVEGVYTVAAKYSDSSLWLGSALASGVVGISYDIRRNVSPGGGFSSVASPSSGGKFVALVI